VESKVDAGSRFSFLVPFATTMDENSRKSQPQTESDSRFSTGGSGGERHPVVSMSGGSSRGSEIDSLLEAFSNKNQIRDEVQQSPSLTGGQFTVQDSKYPVRALKMDEFGLDAAPAISRDSSSSGLKTVESNTPPRKLTPSGKKPSGSQTLNTKELKEKLRCLVVEDDMINRNILCKRLRMDGHEVAESTDGQQAVERIEKDREFDCILMDIQYAFLHYHASTLISFRMPILDGFEATEHIRAHEKAHALVGLPSQSRLPGESNPRIPVFAVSASLRESQRETLLRRGMDGWILKPIDFKRLRAILRGINDRNQRKSDLWCPSCNWEAGGWLHDPDKEDASVTTPEIQNITIEETS
jgi:CheY-like chemotaxis protein